MDFPNQFISATREYCTFEAYVPAPYIRKTFELEQEVLHANIIICAAGFYDLYVNGVRITKGALAPYISASDDLCYYDSYDIAPILKAGQNVIGILLGNGMQNAFDGYIWDFDKVAWRSAPKLALRLHMDLASGDVRDIETDESFKTTASPIFYDGLRTGEYYDARKEIADWLSPVYNDSGWDNCISVNRPSGEPVLCRAEPIVVTHELTPISIITQENGFLYDFGVNSAGVCRLTVNGALGQEISMEHGEYLKNGVLTTKNIQFVPDGYTQKDIYICSGRPNGSVDAQSAQTVAETYTPRFTYHGFRYVFVKGITEKQATKELLTYCVMNSDLQERGGFECSDTVANKLQEMTRISTLANFYYFPTDCPHREKNGWTGDAALSAEHTLLNLNPERSYMEWLHNIRKAQSEEGALPGIVPTGGWGYAWGNGPAWDCVLTDLPYFTYIYRGDKQILEQNATAIFRYLDYLTTRMDDRGLIAIGLGDWCSPGRKPEDCKAPLVLTDSIISMDICKKAVYIFKELGRTLQKEFAGNLYKMLRDNIRKYLIDKNTMIAFGNCQTSQAMAIFYDVFDPGEKPVAFERLLEIIKRDRSHIDTGILGARVLFHVLSMFGQSDLAYKMIVQPTCPSYGYWVQRGATSLWEAFSFIDEKTDPASMNHHFFGDISAWFIKTIGGININPFGDNIKCVNITPHFIETLSYASAYHQTVSGKLEVCWNRKDEEIVLAVKIPEDIQATIILQNEYVFDDGTACKKCITGEYVLRKS